MSVTVSRSGTPSAGVVLAYYAPAQVRTAAVRCAAVDPGLPGEPRLGLALSGGGHRAAVWAAGAVLGLVDAGEAKHIVSASSVSGGSIANGVIVASGDLRSASRADVEAWLKPGLQQWAHSGLFFSGPSTDRWVAGTLGLLIAALAAVVAALTATVSASRELGDVNGHLGVGRSARRAWWCSSVCSRGGCPRRSSPSPCSSAPCWWGRSRSSPSPPRRRRRGG